MQDIIDDGINVEHEIGKASGEGAMLSCGGGVSMHLVTAAVYISPVRAVAEMVTQARSCNALRIACLAARHAVAGTEREHGALGSPGEAATGPAYAPVARRQPDASAFKRQSAFLMNLCMYMLCLTALSRRIETLGDDAEEHEARAGGGGGGEATQLRLSDK